MSSAPTTSETNSPKWLRWFPLWWWGLLLAFYSLVRLWPGDGFDSDKRVVSTIVLVNLAWIVPLAWLLFYWAPFRWHPFKQLSRGKQWLIRLLVATIVIAGFFSIDVDYDGDARWRAIRLAWQADPDEQLQSLGTSKVIDGWQTTPTDYPRFLGNGYWAEVADLQIDSNWKSNPPELIWKKPIGAGWSAFAIVGDHAITQEQRGPNELVVCYHMTTGNPIWTHTDTARHDPATLAGGLGGVGPRATPTIHDGRVYTMGATGIVNCLEANSGQLVWSRNLPIDAGIDPLYWANSGSPLIVPDSNLVVVNGGTAKADPGDSVVNDTTLLAYDRTSGQLAWRSGQPTTSYASPVYTVLAGVPQIIQVNESTVSGYRADDGTELWQFNQPGSSSGNASCSQPIPLAGDRVLVSKGYGIGARLMQIAPNNEGQLSASTLWESRVLKTKLSNLVIRDRYAYGLDHTLLSCVEIDTGKRQWKKRRRNGIGHGQVALVGNHLFALSETGEGILLECNPHKYVELASMQMLTPDGITWNNPAFSGPYLLVRNNLEAACYRLPVVDTSDADDSETQLTP